MAAPTQSKAYAYVLSKSWSHRLSDDHIILEYCPICNNSNWKCYMRFTPDKDGVWQCFVCGENGNLHQLMDYNGDKMNNVMSMREVATAGSARDPLPNVELCAKKLFEEDPETEFPALDYLVGRGFTIDVIERYKLGIEHKFGKRWLVIPYFHKDKVVFAKYRTLPPDAKDFLSPGGYEAPLFNEDCMKQGMDELIFVEGEADALAMLSKGVENVVGVPGANVKKLVWINKLDRIAPKSMYLLYDNDEVGQNAAKAMAQRIGIDKVKSILLPEFTYVDEHGEEKHGKDINDWFLAGNPIESLETLKAEAKFFHVDGVQSAAEIVEEIRKDILEKGSLEPKWKLRSPSVNKLVGGFEEGDVVGIMAEGKVGKAQNLEAKVLTPFGWTRMGDLRIGDRLASLDGAASVVTGVFPQGVKEEYRITFSDGRSTTCCGGHLWTVGDVDNFGRDGYRVVDTLKLKDLSERRRVFVPLFNGYFGTEYRGQLPLDPWLLGALIGDGGMTNTSPIITKTDSRVINTVRDLVDELSCELRYIDGVSWRIVGQLNPYNPQQSMGNKLIWGLRKVGLWGKKAEAKFIPKSYLESSRKSRLSLLQGLMDTDGSIEGNYDVPVFNTSSKQLADDVVYLVRSLGGVATVGEREPKYEYLGEVCQGLTAYRVFVKLHDDVFSNSQKADRQRKRTREFRLTVTSVEKVGEAEMQCIKVSHQSHLYVTDDFIVTHNTSWAIQLIDELVEDYDESGFMFCQEMRPKRLVRKWMSCKTETPEAQFTVATVDAALGIAARRNADYLFGYTTSRKREDAYNTIRQVVRRYGVKFVCFDHLQLLCRSMDHSSQEIGLIAKEFKALAMELGIVIFLIIQPNRVRDGDIIAARNALGSSEIEKAVDAMLCMHRERVGRVSSEEFQAMGFIETETNFAPEVLIRADLTRFTAGGSTTIKMLGDISKFVELSYDDRREKSSLVPMNDQIDKLVAA
jgi:replicative DNA helicase/5S rRNA maturation endonuclease (ribonuclease M5)